MMLCFSNISREQPMTSFVVVSAIGSRACLSTGTPYKQLNHIKNKTPRTVIEPACNRMLVQLPAGSLEDAMRGHALGDNHSMEVRLP